MVSPEFPRNVRRQPIIWPNVYKNSVEIKNPSTLKSTNESISLYHRLHKYNGGDHNILMFSDICECFSNIHQPIIEYSHHKDDSSFHRNQW